MVQGFAIQALDDSVVAIGTTRQALERLIDKEPLLGLATEIVPLEINMEPLTEVGKATIAEAKRVWQEKNITNLHFDKQLGYYALSADERAQLLLNLLTLDPESPDVQPLDFDDRTNEV